MRRVDVRDLGVTHYAAVFDEMRTFTERRTQASPDEIWFTEHEAVFTQGQAGKAEHLLVPGDIPVVQSDRGGQVTYHGPGQLVAYLLLDLRRRGMGPRHLVTLIEQSLIELLAIYAIDAAARPDAPGVYVNGAKIGALGLRIRQGRSYHGLSLNVNMDLEPFGRINPCGLADIEVVQTCDLGGPQDVDEAKEELAKILLDRLRL